MATTTNYGWTTPDDTALVKDGAAAIRTLGSSVDTTTKALNPSTTLGDIEYRSSTANTNTRLGIGTSGQILSVSGGVPAWTTPSAAGGMTLINTGGTTLTGASVTISSIPQTYKDLRLYLVNPLPANNGENNCYIRLNGDTGNNYRASLVGSMYRLAFNASGMYLGAETTNTSTEGAVQITFGDYATAGTFKNAASLSSATTAGAGAFTMECNMGIWKGPAAITSMTITLGAGNWTSGTAYLYGVS